MLCRNVSVVWGQDPESYPNPQAIPMKLSWNSILKHMGQEFQQNPFTAPLASWSALPLHKPEEFEVNKTNVAKSVRNTTELDPSVL